MLEWPVVEVGAQRDDDPKCGPRVGCGVTEELGETVAGRFGFDERPQLFELVDDEHELLARFDEVGRDRGEPAGAAQARRDRRFVFGGGDAPECRFELHEWFGTGDHRHDERAATTERGHETGVHEGALARSRRADDGDERLRVDRGDEPVDELTAPEELRGVGFAEGAQSLVGVGADGGHVRDRR